VDGVDDLGAVDALEVDRGDAEVGVSVLALDDDQRDTFARHLDGVSVAELVRRESSPDAGERRGAAQLFACGGLRPSAAARRPGEDAEQRADGQLDADSQPLVELFPSPVVHADLAAAAALATADEHCAAAGVEVSLGERERFVDAQPGAPEHNDQPSHPQAVRRGAGPAHDGDDLLDGGWIRGIPTALVARRSAGVEARHRGR
jgi:hypothetical protein